MILIYFYLFFFVVIYIYTHICLGYSVLTRNEEVSPELDTKQLECIYCHLKEDDLCSPMVVSQTRSEHDVYIALCQASQHAVTDTGVKMTFYVNNKRVNPPPIQPGMHACACEGRGDAPFFPSHSSPCICLSHKYKPYMMMHARYMFA